jgi:hypothetical protein
MSGTVDRGRSACTKSLCGMCRIVPHFPIPPVRARERMTGDRELPGTTWHVAQARLVGVVLPLLRRRPMDSAPDVRNKIRRGKLTAVVLIRWLQAIRGTDFRLN